MSSVIHNEKSRRHGSMARPGITYHDVAKAAQQLLGENKNPTIETVRYIIGSGSSSTIAPHLRDWKARQGETQEIATKEKLPEEFVALMKGLWDRILGKAEEQMVLLKQNKEQALDEYRQQTQALKDEANAWQQKFNQITQTHEQLAREKLGVEQALAQLQTNNAALKTKQDSLNQQLQDKQTHIDELKRLHQQTQANLEHYRESSREQRLMEQENYKTQQRQLEQTIQQLQQALNDIQPQYSELQVQYKTTLKELDLLQLDKDKLAVETDKFKISVASKEKQLIEVTQSEKHCQTQCQSLLKKYEEQNTLNIALQKEVALLSEKLNSANQSIEDLTAQNKNLAHEKWILGQLKEIER